MLRIHESLLEGTELVIIWLPVLGKQSLYIKPILRTSSLPSLLAVIKAVISLTFRLELDLYM